MLVQVTVRNLSSGQFLLPEVGFWSRSRLPQPCPGSDPQGWQGTRENAPLIICLVSFSALSSLFCLPHPTRFPLCLTTPGSALLSSLPHPFIRAVNGGPWAVPSLDPQPFPVFWTRCSSNSRAPLLCGVSSSAVNDVLPPA